MEAYGNTDAPEKPNVLLGACGSPAASGNFAELCYYFCGWAEVKAVATKTSLHFIDKSTLPRGMILYTDEDEWSRWRRIGDKVLHVELPKWADIMVIAPLSANTLAKIAGGLCDNLLTSIVRAWDYSKPLFVAPDMNTLMWDTPVTEEQITYIDDSGINLILPVKKRLACGGFERAMPEPYDICKTVCKVFQRGGQ